MGAHEEHAVEAPAASVRAAPPMATEGADALTVLAIPPLELKAPWHVRHARKILCAVASMASVGVAYFSYYAWSLHTDPLDRSIAARWRADRAPAPAAAAPSAAPHHQAVTGVVVGPAASAITPAQSRPPQQRAVRTRPVDTAARGEGVSPAPPLARAHPVTHTRPDDSVSETEGAASTRPSGNDKPRSASGSACSAQVAALGLCSRAGQEGR